MPIKKIVPTMGRPVNVVDTESIELWASQLGQYESGPSQDPLNRELLDRVRDYFSRASRRLSEFPAP